jgi:voltage-gated potassium channel
MVGLALAYLVLFAVSVLWLSMPPMVRAVVGYAQAAMWLVFLADFGVRIWLSPRRWRYVASHPIDLVTILLPAIRALRVLRVFAALRVMFERGRRIEFGRLWVGLAAAVVFLAVVGALVVLDAERDAPDALITTFPDAIWWAFVTITTVGYGDEYPITAMGQVSAVFLMTAGIGLLGTVTATLAAWFAERITGRTDSEVAEVLDELRALRADLNRLRADLDRRQAGSDAGE